MVAEIGEVGRGCALAGCRRVRPGHDNGLTGAARAAGEECVDVMAAPCARHVVREVHVVGPDGVPHGPTSLNRLAPQWLFEATHVGDGVVRRKCWEVSLTGPDLWEPRVGDDVAVQVLGWV